MRRGGDLAEFNGTTSQVRIESRDGMIPGRGDFSITVDVRADEETGWHVGDLVSKYDPRTRTGFGLSVITNNGGPGSQTNRRQLSFFLDAGTTPRWRYCGRPRNCRMVFAFAVHRGKLLAGVNDAEPGGLGRLVEYAAPDQWIDRGTPPDGSNAVQTMTVHNGELFVASGCYDGTGSVLSKAGNTTPGGNVYRIDDQFKWHDCGNPYTEPYPNQCPALFSFGGHLFLASSYHPYIYRHDGGKNWTRIGTPALAMCVLSAYRGDLYAAPKLLKKGMFPHLTPPPSGHAVYRHLGGDEWTPTDVLDGAGRVYIFAQHDNQLFAGSWNKGRIHRSADGKTGWINAGDCGQGPLPNHPEPRGEIMAMTSYHHELYAGTLPLAEVYRYDGDQKWTQMKRLDTTTDVPIRRTWACAEYDGGLFFSTLPLGEVHRMDAGAGVTAPDPLPDGWHRVIAARRGDRLELWLDDKLVAQRRDPIIPTLDITCDAPLLIGSGRYAPLRGKLRQVSIQS